MKNGSASDGVRRRYDRLARVYDLMESPMEWLGMSGWRRMLLHRVEGPNVLEVGVGTGKNLPFYRSELSVTAIDISPRMLERATRREPSAKVELRVGNVENLSFPDDSFDSAVGTFVFCSVNDPIQGLRELKRVVKPHGQILLLEHVRPQGRLLGRLFDLLNPLVLHLFGPNINRDTVENVRRAGLEVVEVKTLTRDIVKLIEARVPVRG